MKTLENLLDFFWIEDNKKNLFYYLAFWTKNLYKEFNIKKSNWKVRTLKAPPFLLKKIQKKILIEILEPFWNSNIKNSILKTNTWFHKWKSIVDNAKPHTWKKVIIKIDIQDFFPSIGQNRVFWFFYKNLKYNYIISKFLSWLCTYNNELPQGAPTSPLLATLISINIDNRILSYIKKVRKDKQIKINYTRYADDITISMDTDKKYLIDYLSTMIFNIVEDEWFLVNYTKFKVIYNNDKQIVTWITVNNKLSVWNNNIRTLKAIVYNINKNWWEIERIKYNKLYKTNHTLDKFYFIIQWYIAYYIMINKYSYWDKLKLKEKN